MAAYLPNIAASHALVPVKVTIAFAFAAPLFLFLRERRLIELEREGVLIDM